MSDSPDNKMQKAEIEAVARSETACNASRQLGVIGGLGVGDQSREAAFSNKSAKRGHTEKRRYLGIWAIVCFAILGVLSGTFWMRLRDRFFVSNEAPGDYSGAIKFVDGSQVPMLLEVGETAIYAVILAPKGVIHERPISKTDPLVLEAQGQTITLRGQQNEYNEFVGTAETTAGKKGRFTISRRAEPRPIAADAQREAQSWVLLQSERSVWEDKLDKIDTIKKGKLEEIARLKNFVTDKPRLRAGADAKYAEVAAQLQAARDQLNARKEKAQKLAASLVLAQRVTPFGKLVTLARESNERELRWVESMLRVGERVGPAGIEDEVRRGMDILAIEDQIEKERDRIIELGGNPDA